LWNRVAFAGLPEAAGAETEGASIQVPCAEMMIVKPDLTAARISSLVVRIIGARVCVIGAITPGSSTGAATTPWGPKAAEAKDAGDEARGVEASAELVPISDAPTHRPSTRDPRPAAVRFV
jgi:hypothetical protein